MAQLQQENERLTAHCDRLQAELTQLRQENDCLRQSESHYRQLFEVQQALIRERELTAQKRTRLLETVAQVANLLLRSQDYTTVLPDVVRLLGEAVGSDRCALGQDRGIHPTLNQPFLKIDVEWCKPDILHSNEFSSHPDRVYLWDDVPYIYDRLKQGEVVSCRVADLPDPDRSLFEGQGNTTALLVPILVNHKLWGEIGFDYSDKSHPPDRAEIAILQIVADSLAAAIERQAKDEVLRKSEADLRTLFELSDVGFYLSEVDQPCPIHLPLVEQCEWLYKNIRVVKANSAFAAMYGVDNPEQLIGLRNTDIHVPDSEKNAVFIQGIVENGYRFRNLETEEIDRQGQQRYFLNTGVCIIKDDYVVGCWATQTDITELRETQQALLQAEQDRVAELAKTNQALKNSLDRLAADPDLNSFLGYVLLEIIQQLNLDWATLWLYEPITQTLSFELEIQQGQIKQKHQIAAPEAYLNPSTASTPVWNLLLETKQPVVVNRENAQEYCFQGTYNHQTHQLNLQVAVNLLLMLGDEPIGLLGLASTQRTSFTPKELELAQALTQQATLAVQLMRLSEVAKAEAQQATLLTERNRIARELHDTLAQTFTGVIMQLEAAQEILATTSTPAGQKHLAHAGLLARQGLQEARRSVWSLRPEALESNNLQTALLRLVQQMTDRTPISTEIIVDGTPIPLLNEEIESHLLRIGQESLTNALKYAQAQHIQLHLQFTSEFVRLKIVDDGQGFDSEQPRQGFGIICMQQRTQQIGGEFILTSQTGQGTTIQVTIPVV